MPGHQNDHFDDFDDDEDEGFMTFDARGDDEGVSRGPIILAALVLLAAVVLAIVWVYFNNNKANKDATPEIASQTETYKEAPINGVSPTGEDIDKAVYNSVDGTQPPPLEVQAANGASQEPMVPANQVAAPTTKPVVTKPVAVTPKPVVTTPAPSTKVASAPTKPVVETPKPVVSAPKPIATPAPKAETPKASGGASAQLGSFPSKDQAEKALASYRAKGFKGNAAIVAADLGAKGTWYRVRATGFGSRDEVLAFCAKAKSAGANCIPAN